MATVVMPYPLYPYGVTMQKLRKEAAMKNSPTQLASEIQQQKERVEQAKNPVMRDMHEAVLRCMQLALQRTMGYQKPEPK